MNLFKSARELSEAGQGIMSSFSCLTQVISWLHEMIVCFISIFHMWKRPKSRPTTKRDRYGGWMKSWSRRILFRKPFYLGRRCTTSALTVNVDSANLSFDTATKKVEKVNAKVDVPGSILKIDSASSRTELAHDKVDNFEAMETSAASTFEIWARLCDI